MGCLGPKHRDDDIDAIDAGIGDEWVFKGGGVEPVKHHRLERFRGLPSARCDKNREIRGLKAFRERGARLSGSACDENCHGSKDVNQRVS